MSLEERAARYLLDQGINPKEPVFWHGDNDFIPLSKVLENFARQEIKAKLDEAADKNLEKFRQYENAVKDEPLDHNKRTLTSLARGFKYAAKQTQNINLD